MITTRPPNGMSAGAPIRSRSSRKAKSTQKRKRKNPKLNRLVSQRVEKPRFYLSPCAKDYLRALTDPFAVQGHPCVPDAYDVPSRKFTTVARGMFSAGTLGVGYIVVSPQMYGNNQFNAALTDSTFNEAIIRLDTTLTGVSTTNLYIQAPYSTLDIPEGVLARLVGFGIRARYIGTELNRGGRIIPFRFLSNTTSSNTASSFDILGIATNRAQPMTRKWHTVCYVPSSSNDFQFGQGYIDTNILAVEVSPMGIFVDGCTAGNSFEYEAVAHFEYVSGSEVGDVNIPDLSPGHVDLAGFSAAKSFVSNGGVPTEGGPSLYNRAISWLSTWTPTDVSRVIDVGSTLYQGSSALRSSSMLLEYL
jgi:hypothetical protein